MSDINKNLLVALALFIIGYFSLGICSAQSAGKSDNPKKEFLTQIREIFKGKINAKFRPEYEKNLETVLLAFEGNDSSQAEIIKNLPDYSSITAFIQEQKRLKIGGFEGIAQRETAEGIKKELFKTIPRKRVEKIKFLKAGLDDILSVYAQDTGKGNSRAFFAPFTKSEYGGNISNPNNQYVHELKKTGINVIKHPSALAGGNILLATNKNNEKIVFIGENLISRTRKLYENLALPCSEQKIKELLRRTFNADKAIIMEQGSGLEYCFHIDQIFMPIKKGKIALNDMILPEKSSCESLIYDESFENYNQIFQRSGFDVVRLYTDMNHIKNCQSYANMIVFTNKNSNKKAILLPFFPGSEKLNKKNKEILESEGFSIIPVNDWAYKGQGNSHCLINVLE